MLTVHVFESPLAVESSAATVAASLTWKVNFLQIFQQESAIDRVHSLTETTLLETQIFVHGFECISKCQDRITHKLQLPFALINRSHIFFSSAFPLIILIVWSYGAIVEVPLAFEDVFPELDEPRVAPVCFGPQFQKIVVKAFHRPGHGLHWDGSFDLLLVPVGDQGPRTPAVTSDPLKYSCGVIASNSLHKTFHFLVWAEHDDSYKTKRVNTAWSDQAYSAPVKSILNTCSSDILPLALCFDSIFWTMASYAFSWATPESFVSLSLTAMHIPFWWRRSSRTSKAYYQVKREMKSASLMNYFGDFNWVEIPFLLSPVCWKPSDYLAFREKPHCIGILKCQGNVI